MAQVTERDQTALPADPAGLNQTRVFSDPLFWEKQTEKLIPPHQPATLLYSRQQQNTAQGALNPTQPLPVVSPTQTFGPLPPFGGYSAQPPAYSAQVQKPPAYTAHARQSIPVAPAPSQFVPSYPAPPYHGFSAGPLPLYTPTQPNRYQAPPTSRKMPRSNPRSSSQPTMTFRNGHGFLMRTLWFIFVGWWLASLCVFSGYLLCLTIVGLPLGLLLLNRVPSILTLRPRSTARHISYGPAGQMLVRNAYFPQYSMMARGFYFLLVGWWASLLWVSLAYLLCFFILPIPLGVLMLDRLPAVLTLRRN